MGPKKLKKKKQFTEEDIWVFVILSHQGKQINTKRSISPHPIRITKIKNSDNVNAGKFVWRPNHSYIAGGSVNDTVTLEKNMAVSYKTIHVLIHGQLTQ